MITRILFALLSLAVLGALLYVSQSDSDSTDTGDTLNTEPGYVATQAQLIETDADGRPRYILNADRIEQPQPQGTIFLTAPRLDYQPDAGEHWLLSADEGQLPQDARSADFSGAVLAQGTPEGQTQPVHISTEQLHVDMIDKVATSAVEVTVDWGGNVMRTHGMRAELQDFRLQSGGGRGAVAR